LFKKNNLYYISDKFGEKKINKILRKMKRCGGSTNLPILGNTDKDRIKKEGWRDPDRNLGCIPHPARILALGGVGRGKTNTLKILFLEHQKTNNPFKELIVVSPDTSTEWVDAEPTLIITDLPSPEVFNPDVKTLLVIDDFELTGLTTSQKKKLSNLFRYVISHCNVSIFMSFQSFLDCNSIARKCANVFIIWDSASRLERSMICNRVGLPKGTLDYLFKYVAPGDYDSIMVDRTIATPAFLRHNVFEKLDEDDIEKNMKKLRIQELKEIKKEAKQALEEEEKDSDSN